MSALVLLVALSLATALVPHGLPLERAAPATAAAVWLLALAVRAGVVVAVTTIAFASLAHTGLLEAVLHWCWHEVLPDIPGWIGLAEHPVAHAVVAVPLGVIAIALLARAVHALRAWAGLRRLLAAVGWVGPGGTTVIPDEKVLVAVTRFGPGRVLVSQRALEVMDAQELAAGLAHELAHIRRRHRPALLAASVLATVARALPGTTRAERELTFQLERDADAWAVGRVRDPLSLASAICKAAEGHHPGVASLSGGGTVTRRLAALLGDGGVRSVRVERTARALAVCMAGLALALAVAAPVWASAIGDRRAGPGAHICSHG